MRVLVFRAVEVAARTATSLAAVGHEAVVAPVTTILARAVDWPSGRFDAILATSANAFSVKPPDEARLRLPVFVVGRTTAEAARAAGFLDIRVATGDAASLVTLLKLTLPGSARLLYLAGRDRKPDAEALLAEAGHTVIPLEVYAAGAVTAWPENVVKLIRQGNVGAALHFSRRGAELALALASRHEVHAPFLDMSHYCLSHDVAEPLLAAGVATVRVASRPDETALLALLQTGRA